MLSEGEKKEKRKNNTSLIRHPFKKKKNPVRFFIVVLFVGPTWLLQKSYQTHSGVELRIWNIYTHAKCSYHKKDELI